MTLQQLEDLCNELLVSDGENSMILSAFADAELLDAYAFVLHQFGLELVCGVYEHSSWMSDLLLIGTNQGPIHASQTAFYAVLLEMDRRGLDLPEAEEKVRGGDE